MTETKICKTCDCKISDDEPFTEINYLGMSYWHKRHDDCITALREQIERERMPDEVEKTITMALLIAKRQLTIKQAITEMQSALDWLNGRK